MEASRSAFDTENLALTVLGPATGRARGRVVVEEAIETSAVDEGVFGIQNSETKCIARSPRETRSRIVGVIESGIPRIRTLGRGGNWLIISVQK